MKLQIMLSRTDIDINKFIAPYGNRGGNKPRVGGIWTSSKIEYGKSEWLKFAEREKFYENLADWNMFEIVIDPKARLLTIDSKEDYLSALKKYGVEGDGSQYLLSMLKGESRVLCYEKLKEDYYGLNLTTRGLLANYYEFYGWDCESTVWFNLDSFASIEPI